MRPLVKVQFAVLLLCGLTQSSSVVAQMQNPGAGMSPSGPTGPIPVTETTPPYYAQMVARERAKREAKLLTDADRIAVLANQLKAELNKGPRKTLSVEDLKMAQEIEKLAHSVSKTLKE